MIVGTSACVGCVGACRHMCVRVHNCSVGEDVWYESQTFLDWMFLFVNAVFIAVGG